MIDINSPSPSSFTTMEDCMHRISQCLSLPHAKELLIFFLIKRLWKWQSEGINEELRGSGLNPTTFTSLLMLYSETGRSMAPSALAASTGECRANMTRICDELDELGLIQRTRSLTDRRSINLVLSSHGAIQVEALLPRLLKRIAYSFSPLNAAEKSELERLLKIVLIHPELAPGT